jgi:two-component system, cell cycle response regulator
MKILLVEDDEAYAALLTADLERIPGLALEIRHATTLEGALAELRGEIFSVVLLDLALPDSDGLATFRSIATESPETAVMILTALDDQELALGAMQEGAQEYLVKSSFGSDVLVRSIRYAIERHRLLSRIRANALLDPETGLHNEAGFRTLAEQQLRLAERNSKDLLVLLLTLEPPISASSRRQARLQALAEVLRRTLRRSDVIARISADVFAVVAVDAEARTIPAVRARLVAGLDTLRDSHELGPDVRLQMGAAHFGPGTPPILDSLLDMARADLASRYPA